MIQGTGVFIPPSGFLVGELVAPSGTRMTFNQSTPPFGWVTDASASYTDCTPYLRVSSAGTSQAGAGWTTWNQAASVNGNAFTLSITQMPSHTHPVVDPGHTMPAPGAYFVVTTGGGSVDAINSSGMSSAASTDTTLINPTVNNTGTGASITPTITTPNVKYTDLIIGVRS